MEDLNAASLEDVHEWFKKYYGPSNAVIAIAGDIDPKTAKAKVEKYFGHIPAGEPVAKQQVWIAKRTGNTPPDRARPCPAGTHLHGVEHSGAGLAGDVDARSRH